MIRKAEIEDIESIQYLIQELTDHDISNLDVINRLEYIDSSMIDTLYVYEEHQKVVGLLGFRIRENIEEKRNFVDSSKSQFPETWYRKTSNGVCRKTSRKK